MAAVSAIFPFLTSTVVFHWVVTVVLFSNYKTESDEHVYANY